MNGASAHLDLTECQRLKNSPGYAVKKMGDWQKLLQDK